MSEFLQQILVRYWKLVLILPSAFFLCLTLLLIVDLGIGYGNKSAQTFRDNVLIESSVGGLFLFFPTLVGIFLGQRLKRIAFYENIQKVLDKIEFERERGNITPVSARDLVIEISNSMGKEILEVEEQKNFPSILIEEKNCGICGLEAQVTKNKKCQNCKLDCFAWEKQKTQKLIIN